MRIQLAKGIIPSARQAFYEGSRTQILGQIANYQLVATVAWK